VIRTLLLLLLGAAAIAVFLTSSRSWSLVNAPRVESVAALPDTPQVEAILAETDAVTLLPYPPGERHAQTEAGRGIGYVYREVSLVKMPFWAYPDLGLAACQSGPEGVLAAPLSADQLRRLEGAAGGHFSAYGLALWRHLWGWLFVAGFVLWFALQRRAEGRGEAQPEASGEMAGETE
jgi:hypothetical protein